MNISRLEIIDHDLLQHLDITTPTQRLSIATKICQLAFQRIKLNHPVLEQAIIAIGDTSESKTLLQLEVEILVEQLDNDYFNLQDAQEMGQALLSEVETAFNKARVANAIYFALGDNSVKSLGEAIYEAQMAIDDLPAMTHIIKEELSSQGGA